MSGGFWSGLIRIYFNSVEQNTIAEGNQNLTTPRFSNHIDRFGTDYRYINRPYYIGKMDDIRIYNRAIADSEIQALYHEGEITADFTVNDTTAFAGFPVQFSDLSNPIPASWAWDFDNDGTVDSNAQNPQWTYNTAGTYNVSLTVTDSAGWSTTEIKTDYITVINPPDISVSDSQFVKTISIGDTSSAILTLQNSGLGELTFSLSTTYIDSTSRNYGDYADENRIGYPLPIAKPYRDTGDVSGTYNNSSSSNTGMVWVNNYLYMIDYSSHELLKYDIASESVLSSYSIHNEPYGITWDGTYLWIGNSSGNIYAYNLDGSSAGFSFSCPFVNYPALTWDGSNFIVNEFNINNPTFYKLDETGAIIESYSSNFDRHSWQIVFVKGHQNGEIWSTNGINHKMIQFKLSNGTVSLIQEFDNPNDNDYVYSIAHDGKDLWWSDWDGPLYKIDDGIVEGTWLSYDICSGNISANSSQDIRISFNTNELTVGQYLANLIINSNDPDESTITIPVTLNVIEPIPVISCSDTLGINFGSVYLGITSPDSLILIKNIGTDTLFVNSLSFVSGNTVFSYNYTENNPILPSETDTIFVNFTPSNPVTYIDSLVITNNSNNKPVVKIELKGEGIEIPPAKVQNLTVTMNGLDTELNWEPVTTDIYGNPMSIDYYLIYRSVESPYEDFQLDGYVSASTTTYTKSGDALFNNRCFYRVTAYKNVSIKDMDILKKIILRKGKIKKSIGKRK